MARAKRPYTRRIKFIRPALQLRTTLPFVAVASGALLLQFILLTAQIDELAARLPPEAIRVRESLPGMLMTVLGISAGLILPLTVVVGIGATFRVAGPVYRFEQHLDAIARGEDPGVCRIRKTDELHSLCASINAAVDRLRADARSGAERDVATGARESPTGSRPPAAAERELVPAD